MVVVTSLGPPEEGMRHVEPNTLTYINEKGLGKGKLYISESRVSWVGDGGSGHQFSLTYEHISLHAVSRDRSTFPNSEHLYLMIDKKLTDSEGMPTPTSTPESSDIDDDSESDGDASDMTEIRFVPENKACLQDLFKHMSDCQALHPDPENDEEDEMGEEGGDDEDGDEQEEGDGDNGGQFDDAEEDEEEAMDTA